MAKARKKITRQELKQDEVAETLEEMLESVRANWRKYVVGGLVVILLIISGVVYSNRRTQIKTETSLQLNMANLLLDQLPGMLDEAQRETGLRDTINGLQRIIDDYSGSQAAHLALYLQGNCYFQLDELEEAQDIYQRYSDEAKDDEDAARGEIALGEALENQAYLTDPSDPLARTRVDEARIHYIRAEELAGPGSYLYTQARMNQARLLELVYFDAQAIEIYREIMETRPPPSLVEPREDGPEDGAPTGNEFQSMIRAQIRSMNDTLSFATTAKLRFDRLEANRSVIVPPTESP